MRSRLVVLCLMLGTVVPATAQVSFDIGFPNLSIGIDLPLYPELEPVPGYPVYYAPRLDANYFFYDGMYWVYQDDSWYASSWYNGPWALTDPESVPLYVLRIPVRYYRQPPVYFHGWLRDAPPRWGDHWGNGWAQRRSGWDRWEPRSAPAPAPLPIYQRQYSGDRYPHWAQQQALHNRNYRYRSQDPVVRQRYQTQHPMPESRQERNPSPRGGQHYNPYLQQAPVPQHESRERNTESRDGRAYNPYLPPPQRAPIAPHDPSRHEGGNNMQPSAPPPARPERNGQRDQPPSRPHQQEAAPQRQPERNSHDQEDVPHRKGAPQDKERGKRSGPDDGRQRGDDRGPDHRR